MVDAWFTIYHADAETTLQIYAECTKNLKHSEIISFEKFFEEQKEKQELQVTAN